MLRKKIGAFVPLTVLSITVGCGAETPTQPTSTASTPPATVSTALSVAEFSVSGWHADGTFHYIPKLTVAASADGGTVGVRAVSFDRSAGIGIPSSGLGYPNPAEVSAGGARPLINGQHEIVTDTPLDAIIVRVAFIDAAGQAGTAVAEIVVPPLPQETPAATLAIRAFSVEGSSDNGRFYYWPKLTLAETTGRSPVSTVNITFELLDVGAAGRVPPSRNPIAIPAGATVLLDKDLYDGPWLSIDSTANASRVSVVISYVDAAGRGGTVSAAAEVSR